MESLRKALLPLRQTLEHFTFTPKMLKCECLPLSTRNVTLSGNCSFADFTALKTLIIPPWALLGWATQGAPPLHAVVPKNLQELELINTFASLQSFQWWGQEMHGHFARSMCKGGKAFNAPGLEKITLIDDSSEGVLWFNSKVRRKLKPLCKRNTVALHIHRTDN